MLRPLTGRVALGVLIAAAPAAAQTYTGAYAARNDQGGQTVVTLRQVGDSVTGTIVGTGSTFHLRGVLEEGSIVGAVTGMPGGGLWFEAELDEGDLYLTLIAAGADGQPDYDQMTTLVFARQGGAAAGAADPLAGGAGTGRQTAPAAGGGGGGALDDGTPLGREWSAFLVGKKATKMSSYASGSSGGYSSRTDVHLCRDGQFGLNSSSMVSVDVGDAGGYSAGRGGDRGTWRIITQGDVAGIELRYANGAVEQYRLEFQDNKTYVDGERWLITPSEVCGG